MPNSVGTLVVSTDIAARVKDESDSCIYAACRNQDTQASVSTAQTGTQCTVPLCSAGSQTETDGAFPRTQCAVPFRSAGSQAETDGAFSRLPTLHLRRGLTWLCALAAQANGLTHLEELPNLCHDTSNQSRDKRLQPHFFNLGPAVSDVASSSVRKSPPKTTGNWSTKAGPSRPTSAPTAPTPTISTCGRSDERADYRV
ncbi:uncharacterized protein LOC144142387 isoform X3 [Haemaphysalis longicornis]